MGFLMGAYGKLMAGKLVRDLQYRLTGIQSRLRRVTREMGDMEKMFTAQERNMKAMMQVQMQNSIFGAASYIGLPIGNMGMGGMDGFGAGLANMASMQQLDNAQMQQFSMIQQQFQAQFAMAQSTWQNVFEMQRESMLQPLKDLEDSLQTEKDNLESRLKIANNEYEAQKKMEDSGVKGLTPEYTGQG